MKNKKLALLMVVALSITILSACTKDTKKTQDTITEIEQNQQAKVSVNKVDNTSKADSSVSEKETTGSKNIQVTNTTNTVTKIDGRREEFLERLHYIQKQLAPLPEEKDLDATTTNDMTNYYRESYDMYDEALNEIYSLLKEQLSQDTMNNLQAEEIKWIKQKEDAANKAASQYKGGIFAPVAYNISLYESTKNRCNELVNNYMTDSKIKINTSKQDYINKLDIIEKEILSSEEHKNVAASSVTRNMTAYTNKEYDEWDAALKEIYSLLKQQLSSDEMKKLDTEKEQWTIQKENRAKKSEDIQGVGSQLGNIAYKASLAHTIQSRCYELVYRYMK
jgi:uncharacterized protein YecT (DUF1311 family)